MIVEDKDETDDGDATMAIVELDPQQVQEQTGRNIFLCNQTNLGCCNWRVS